MENTTENKNLSKKLMLQGLGAGVDVLFGLSKVYRKNKKLTAEKFEKILIKSIRKNFNIKKESHE